MFQSTMPLDKTQQVRTMGACVITLVFVGASILLPSPIRVGVAALMAVATVLAWATSPRELVIDDVSLRVRRRAWPEFRVPRTLITSAAPFNIGQKVVSRVFGVSGVFGNQGLFYARDLGRVRMLSTHSGLGIVVRAGAGRLPLVLTPEDVDGTLARLDPRRSPAEEHVG